ncbi:nucleotide-binding universal stress UspA family protein [Actinoplanes octamycinicus]|uniref:Nucleotide-binding universal stress UspA family protein n=1 Tax=Actinoplanes octamycinicus TaxID=135948 RepID=A0A7W7H2M6_9ACTN|nr:universal stress protein [Actinoplanes octamycinicus]MBB4742866.1 nucleotide-binding universal stress UspA family protein [Actinoplanes octamycinicus]
MRTQTVVVAVDGTDASRAAIRWATAEAQRRERPLRVVHVMDWNWGGARFDVAGHEYETARRHADALAAGAARQARDIAPELDVDEDVLIGDAAAQLIIESESAELIVLGHRGHGGFAGLRLGSVSQRVATHAHCPAVVVRGNDENDARPVIAGVDDSAAADGVLETAFAAAHQRGVHLVMIRSYMPPFPHYHGSLPPAQVHTPAQDAAEHTRLAEQVAPWQSKYPQVRVEMLVSHDSAAAVLVGVSHTAQLVVVGSRGHGVIAGTLLGSTGLQLLHHAECPVLIVRTGKKHGPAR